MRLAFTKAATLFAASMLALGGPALAAEPRGAAVITVASLDKGKIAALAAYAKEQKFDFYKLGDAACDAAAELRQEIDTGLIAEEGETSPPHLAKFSQEFLNAIPGLFNYERIYIVSPAMLPIEMVRKDGIFVGDRIAVSHEFDLPDHGLRGDSSAPRPLASYVVEAVIPMDAGQRRIEQDIVEVALDQEKDFPVTLDFNSGFQGMKRVLERGDIAILHIDTHGSGPEIQVSRDGAMMAAKDIPQRLQIPAVLLFGCEGVASNEAFGSVMHAHGVDAAVSSIVKFNSFGITGDPKQEKTVYEAFFAAIRGGETIGTALVQFRDVARMAKLAPGNRRTLTRHFFVLIGDGQLKFAIK